GNKTIAPPIEVFHDAITKFDSLNFYDNDVSKTKEGFNQIGLIIEGIHCAACVWLNERILLGTKGIVDEKIK
ncbi:hypothetical protein ACN091_10870, partial [Aliarcobacter butzleri]|uniref:hypothetical protein n=1 Tax=Aliarcobacter butzleri TaxID=28197 RepID=UPI003AEB5D36